jgi:O-methyltransferase
VNFVYLDAEPEYITANGGEESRRLRENGLDWPAWGLTMIGLKRLDNNVQRFVERVLGEGVPGDLFEAGVWSGAAILMRAVLVHGDSIPRVWLADSFEGVPPPKPERYPADAGDEHHLHDALKMSLEKVKANFKRFGLLDDRVMFIRASSPIRSPRRQWSRFRSFDSMATCTNPLSSRSKRSIRESAPAGL